MNPELPKSIREALTQEATPGIHPSLDVLTAFIEQSLPTGEKHQVTDHLARCAECREVVFLARNAEESIAEEQNWMAVRAVPRMSATLTPKAQARQGVAGADMWRLWPVRLIWAVPAAAALVLVIGFVVQRFTAIRPSPQIAAKTESQVAEPSPTESRPIVTTSPLVESAPAKPGRERQTNTGHTNIRSSNNVGDFAAKSTTQGAPEYNAAPNPAPSNSDRTAVSVATAGAANAAIPPNPTRNSFAASEAERPASEGATIGGLMGVPQAYIREGKATQSRWRVTSEGRLEHFAQGGWMRVLPDQTTTFRTVSVVGKDIWTGGSGGSLFHSSDRGEHWSKVVLSDWNNNGTDIIISIQFADSQRGHLTTEKGLHFSTQDGGMTWTRE